MAQITTTLGLLVNAEPALARVLAVKLDKPGGEKVRYHLVKLARLVGVETKHFWDERTALLERFGTGEPKSLAVTSPEWPAFISAMKALEEIPVDIPWGPITDKMIEPYADVTGKDCHELGVLFDFGDLPQP